MENFSELNNPAEVKTPAVDEKKKAKISQMRELLKQTVSEDPTFVQKLKSLSNSVAVVNTLGYGDSGNIIVDESTKHLPKDERRLITTSQIVGYRLQNIGNTPIKYLTEEFVKNEEGTYVGTRVEKVAKPGETFALSRKYMTIFCSQPEISFQLSNGKIIRGSGTVKDGDIDRELEAYYFTFNDKSIKVNSDDVKINIAKKIKQGDQTKWVVKPEFEATFGYLNNAKAPGRKGRQPGTGKQFTVQDMAANYINKLLQESGLI